METPPAPTTVFHRTTRLDVDTPPPDLYGRPRLDRFMHAVTVFGDVYTPALGRPLLRRNPRLPAPARGPRSRWWSPPTARSPRTWSSCASPTRPATGCPPGSPAPTCA